MASILIENIKILTMNNGSEVIDRGTIEITDNTISFVGKTDEWVKQRKALAKATDRDKNENIVNDKCKNNEQSKPMKIINGQGLLALPGLINTHCHAPMSLLRGYADDLPLAEWLEEQIWPAEANLTGEDVYWGTMLSIVEMIKSGTTTFADMYFFIEDMSKAVEKSGLRSVLSRGLIGVGPSALEGLKDTRELYKSVHGMADGRITLMVGPHAPYTCPPGYLKEVIKIVEELNIPVHIHLSETAGEVEDSIKAYGLSPIKHMEKAGLFNYQVLAAHCVHVTNEDIDILANNNVAVSHNPCSNLKLASGISPVPKMLKKNIHVSLGTDGPASNNNLDMFEEMKFGSLIQKTRENDATVLPAIETLKMATVNGAKALGLDGQIGSIEKGKLADIILIDLNKSHLWPQHSLTSHLVYSARGSDIETVIVNGNVLMENGKLLSIDENLTYSNAHRCAQRLVQDGKKKI